MGSYLFLLLILACPLMMVWMMRGMHGGHGHATGGEGPAPARETLSLEQLKHERDQLNELIGERAEQAVADRHAIR